MQLETATIYFADGSTLQVKSGDVLVPVSSYTHDDNTISAMSKPVTIIPHVHDGLFPSILSALYSGDYFYVEDDMSTVYRVDSIIKIKKS